LRGYDPGAAFVRLPARRFGLTTLSIVIPAYNEQARLPALFAALAADADAAVDEAGMELVEALIVDDGSSDRTAAMLREAAAENPRLVPVRAYEENRGKGAAFAAGVERARGEYVLLADVDLSTPLGELPNLELLPAGVLPPNPAELLEAPALDVMLRSLLQDGRKTLVIDAAPLLPVADAQILLNKPAVDASVIVAPPATATGATST